MDFKQYTPYRCLIPKGLFIIIKIVKMKIGVLKEREPKNRVCNFRQGGYAGIENFLFFDDKTRMLFGNAKDSIQKLVTEIKSL